MFHNNIVEKIKEIKQQRDAIILAHNYQLPEVQDIADYVGDSLELAKKSSSINSKIIIFCGVHFMAETAKIFNPDKKVLMPDLHAGCPMANMISPAQLKKQKKTHPDAAVICYINSTAAVKMLSDICCTSANGVRVANSITEEKIIFVPDQYLGAYVARQVKNKEFYLWRGYCPTHMIFTKEGILRIKQKYPDAKVLVHPECRLEVQDIADAVCSTSQMISYAHQSAAKRFIIGTEIGMLHRLKKENPDKEFVAGDPNAICPNMKLTNLENVLWALEDLKFEIEIEEKTRLAALKVIEKMIKV